MTSKNIISIIIPVYNNEKTIKRLCNDITNILDKNNHNKKYKIILINDGSTDNSWNEIKLIYAENPKIYKLINLTKNFGQISALLSGLSNCNSDCVVCISADLQDTPEIIPQMIKAWQEGSKIVIANRRTRDDGLIYNILSYIAWQIIRLFLSKEIPKNGFDYFLIDKKVKDFYIQNSETHSFMQGLILSYGEKPFLIDYDRKSKEGRNLTTSTSRRLKYFIDGIFGYSFIPLRILTVLGCIIFLSTVFYSLYILVMYFNKGAVVSGWASLAISISLLNGLILLGLGIIGEYIIRVLAEVRNRPKYIIKEIIQSS
jgi:glycosyltransferase involved in cell wall biosynthesis